MTQAHDVRVQRYWFNILICWHHQGYLRLFKSNNGVVSYCSKCGRKRLGIHDFGYGGLDGD